MATRKEPVVLRGMLRGEGRQRECRVRATKNSLYVDELTTPIDVVYSSLSVDDDNFPDGSYEVEFSGQKELLTKKQGYYLARQ